MFLFCFDFATFALHSESQDTPREQVSSVQFSTAATDQESISFVFSIPLDMELGQLPRRETDNSIILTNATRMYKLHAIQTEAKIVKR
jgi:hypothetical protein